MTRFAVPAARYETDLFEEFTEAFRPVFARADQFRRFRIYLRGLLEPGERKNVEAIAARAAPGESGESDLAQALQHFISHSPWDAGRVFAATRRTLRKRHGDSGGRWVIHDAAFPKKGWHSVGVQRQFARALGRKVNCQIGVVVSHCGPAGFFPLVARLYLPGHWLREYGELAEKLVPAEHRRPATKAEIALALVDELLADGGAPAPSQIATDPGYATAHDLLAGVRARGLSRTDAPVALAEAHRRFDALRTTLGIDHFEGRTWAGWHHHVSVAFAAAAFLATEG